ncbi:IclR family transcriptional regulator [Marmoricola endophyticus]|uniref:IclR family transcriptional regulator n=1 Tax=Marmoricola endophyticus TaxID=2040280 RepID=A0A917BIE2_9ACTN|nr:IclR family transcriptional regulator [Marmoricola endophyticus]GGF40610.1 IclR family transcriptional regulator [Marmoricola endophyticus]
MPGVQSVERAFALLTTIAESGGSLPINEAAAGAGVPLATAHRILGTLVATGHVRRDADRRYALGFGLVPLGTAAGSTAGLGAEHALAGLVDALGETANLALLDGDRIAYVAQAPGRHRMRMFTEVGRRVHPHCTAVGKVLLARRENDEVRDLLARTGLPRMTPQTITSTEDFLAALRTVRETSYAVDSEEQEVGVRCVAVAVPDVALPLAVSVSAPAARLDDEQVARAVPHLVRAADVLSRDLDR